MKTYLVAILLLLSQICLNAESKKYRFLTESYPPYEYVDPADGVQKGMDIEIIELVCKKAGIKYEILFLPFARALEDMKYKKADCIFSLLKKPEREEYLYYSSIPLYVGTNRLFAIKDYYGDIKTYNDLNGKKVGVVRGNSYGKKFDENAKIERDPSTDQKMLFNKLVAGRSDIVITTEEVGFYYIKRLKGKVRPLTLVTSKEDYYIAFSNKELRDLFNTAFVELENSGEIKKIRLKYIK